MRTALEHAETQQKFFEPEPAWRLPGSGAVGRSEINADPHDDSLVSNGRLAQNETFARFRRMKTYAIPVRSAAAGGVAPV